MTRASFLKSLLVISIAPKIISQIKPNTPPFYSTDMQFSAGLGSRSLYDNGKWTNLGTYYSYSFDHKKNKGSYTAHLKDGRKITFPVYEYDQKKWQQEYGYLSEINL